MKHVMKGSISRRALLLVAPAIDGALVWGGVASGTPPAGVSTKTTLADVTVIDTVKADVPPLIKFRTTDPVEVAQFSNTAQPADPSIGQAAFSSGWHMHTGPIIIAVTAGELTFYDRAGAVGSGCRVTHVSAGQGYFETPGEPILARNEGTVEADWTTTQIIPVGGSQRVDVTPGFCGVS